MKIQCPCGAKYVIDVTPGMPPVQFVCPNCGQDYSAFVNELIRRELGEQNSAPPVPAQPAGTPPTPPAPTPTSSRLKISVSPSHTQTPAPAAAPISPQTPRARQIQESFAAENFFWRKMGLIFGVAGTFAVLAIGAWMWYAWYAAVPHVYLSVKFDNRSFSGTSFATNGQIVFLHGGTLARYNLKTKKPAWSLELVTQQQVDDMLKQEDEEEAKARATWGRPEYSHVELPSAREENARAALERELSLYVSGENIWIAKDDELSRYDWDTGKVLQQITAPNGERAERGNELLISSRADDGTPLVAQIDLATGGLTTNEFHDVPAIEPAQNSPRAVASATGGLPLSPNASAQPMNPQRVAQQAQNLTPAARIALPALIANNSYNQRIENELNDGENGNQQRQGNFTAPSPPETEDFMLIPDGDNFLEFSSRLVKENFVQREAMKAPPAKSALDSGDVSVVNESAAVNEQLNEMQRNAGADTVTEDQSVYQVTIRKAGSPDASWNGEVVGAPALFPLKTVNVLAAGKSVIVFDKSNKKLWQSELSYPVSPGSEQSSYGQGPCVEQGDSLYVFDQAVLTAFDLSSGNVRWRLPSVGIVGLFFDDEGMMYVNTTTGNPDDIKYARQIDVTKKIENVLLKVDPKTGRTLWSANPHGVVCYLSGKFIYACYSFDPGEADDQSGENVVAMMNPPFLRITRINPKNGDIMWEYTEARAPVDMQFDRNSIRLIFKKEVEVLHYLAL